MRYPSLVRCPSHRPVRARIRHRIVYTFVALSTLPGLAWADLPDVGDPSGGGAADGLMGTIQDYAAAAGVLLGLVLATAAFLVVGGSAVGQFTEARQRNEWGGFVTTLVVGGIMIVFVVWLADQASEILGS